MENYYLDWSELTKRVYITNGKKKKDVTELFDKIVSQRGAKIISSNLPVSGNEATPFSNQTDSGEVVVCSHQNWKWDGGRIEPIFRRCKDCDEVISEQTDR